MKSTQVRRSSRIKSQPEPKPSTSKARLRILSSSSSEDDLDDIPAGTKNENFELKLSSDSSSDEDDSKSKSTDAPRQVEPRLEDHREDLSDEGETAPKEYFDFSQILNSQNEVKIASQILENEQIKREDEKKEISDDVTELLKKGEKEVKKRIAARKELERIEEETNNVPEDEVPCENVEIKIQLPSFITRNKKRAEMLEIEMKRQFNAARRKLQLFLHKVGLLCCLGRGFYLNSVINDDTTQGLALSIVPSANFYPPAQSTLTYVEKLVKWYSGKYIYNRKSGEKTAVSLPQTLEDDFKKMSSSSPDPYVAIFVALCRVLGLKCRLVLSLQPPRIRPAQDDATRTKKRVEENQSSDDDDGEFIVPEPSSSGSKKNEKEGPSPSKKPRASKKNGETIAKTSAGSSPLKKSAQSGKKAEGAPSKKAAQSANNTDDPSPSKKGAQSAKKTDDPSPSKKVAKSAKKPDGPSPSKKPRMSKKDDIDYRVLSSDDEDDYWVEKRPRKNPPKVEASAKKKQTAKSSRSGVDIWAEIYVEADSEWICVDVVRGRVKGIQSVSAGCTKPLLYVMAWNADDTVKDVTRRYATQWLTTVQKLRVEPDWWEEVLEPWAPRRTKMEKEENKKLDKLTKETPLPITISEYKDHPHFALKRHLLKFEAIYPPDAQPLGYVKKEPVYSRICVVELHSRETWMRQAKLVRRTETPYKVVKARPKWDKVNQKVIKDLPLELFGYWQTEDYMAPPAVDGKVPRNEYGNVELYKPSMLPPGTVHLQVPGLVRIAKKLGVDCAPALVGWEYHGGSSHPILDGFIVCEEDRDALLDLWNTEIDESAKRSKEKAQKRAKKNWKRLVKAVILRKRLARKYGFKFENLKGTA